MPKHGRSEESALNEGQLKKLWNVCKEPTDKVLVGLCAFGGLRVGEAIHLNASWIKEGCVVIPSFMPCNCWECKGGSWHPKTKAGARTIPLPSILKPVLMDYLRTHPDGLKMTRQTANNRVKALQEKAGLPHIFPHALRASYATLLATKGMQAMTICYLLGWSRLEVAQHYVRIAEAKTDAAKQIKEIFG